MRQNARAGASSATDNKGQGVKGQGGMGNMEDLDKVLATLGLKLVNVIVGAASSFATLRFFDGLTVGAKWSTFVGGWALAAWGAPPLRDFMEAPAKIELLYVMLIGLFGMAAIAEVFKFIKDGALIQVARSILDRFTSRQQGKP